MPRNSNGTTSPLPGTLVSVGQTLLPSQHNPMVEDLYGMMTESLSRNGQGGMLAALDMGGFQIRNMAKATLPNDGVRNSDVDQKQVYVVKSSNYTAVLTDNNAFHNFTGATPTLFLTAAAILGASWHYDGYATGGPVIINPNGAELINGVTTVTVPQNCKFAIKCDGTGFLCTITTGLGVANSALATMAQATVKGRASGAGTGTPTDLDDAALFAILGNLVPARPVITATVGQFTSIYAGLSGSMSLPAGGTWAFSFAKFNASGQFIPSFNSSIAAGGSLLAINTASDQSYGFAWRIA